MRNENTNYTATNAYIHTSFCNTNMYYKQTRAPELSKIALQTNTRRKDICYLIKC